MTIKDKQGHTLYATVLLFLFIILTSVQTSAQRMAENFYQAAYEAFEDGNYPDAIDYCDRAIGKKKDYTDAYWLRGTAFFRINRVNESIHDYSKTISLMDDTDKDLSEVYVNRGFAYSSIYYFDQAITDYTTALEINPDNSQALWYRGMAYQNEGIYDTAISDYSVAAQYYQKDRYSLSTIYANRGQCFVNLKKINQALADCNTALLLNPDNGSALWVRGIVYEQMDQPEKAIHDLEYALGYYENMEAELARLYLKIGTNYYVVKNYKKALRNYNRAINNDPKYIQAYYNRALLLLNQLDKIEKANRDFNKLTIIDTGRTYYSTVGKYFLGDKDTAMGYLKNFPDKFASPVEMSSAYFDVACLYALMKNEQNAISYLEKSLYSGYTDFYNLKTEPAFQYIRQSQAFQDLMKKYGVNL